LSLSFLLSELLVILLLLMGNRNARSPAQANLVQVRESPDIAYGKNAVNFSVSDRTVADVYRRCAQSYLVQRGHREGKAGAESA
jgi:hypothetical protein